MNKNVLEGYTCLECKHYRGKERKYDNQRKAIVIPQHCVSHPKLFLEWWERNKDKCNDEIECLGCFELDYERIED